MESVRVFWDGERYDAYFRTLSHGERWVECLEAQRDVYACWCFAGR